MIKAASRIVSGKPTRGKITEAVACLPHYQNVHGVPERCDERQRRSQRHLAGLMTQRSLVRIQAPPLEKAIKGAFFVFIYSF